MDTRFLDENGQFIDIYRELGLEGKTSFEEANGQLRLLIEEAYKTVNGEQSQGALDALQKRINFLNTIGNILHSCKSEYDAEYDKIFSPAQTTETVESKRNPGKFSKEEIEAMYFAMRGGRLETEVPQPIQSQGTKLTQELTGEIPPAETPNANNVNVVPKFYDENGQLRDYYRMLYLNRTATFKAIKDAFYRESKNNDILEEDSPEIKAKKMENKINLANAYYVLKNYRDLYDAEYDKIFPQVQPTKTEQAIDKLLGADASAKKTSTKSAPQPQTGKLTQEEIEAMLVGAPNEMPNFYDKNGQLKDYYRILRLNRDASFEEIQDAFNSEINYNSILVGEAPEIIDQKRRNMMDLSEAYDVLKNYKDTYDAEHDKHFSKEQPAEPAQPQAPSASLTPEEFEEMRRKNFEKEEKERLENLLNNTAVSKFDFYDENGKLVDLYALLGIKRDATSDDIYAAYQQKMASQKIEYAESIETVLKKRSMQEAYTRAYLILTVPINLEYKNAYDAEKEKQAREEFEAKEAEIYANMFVSIRDFYDENGKFRDFYEVLGITRDTNDIYLAYTTALDKVRVTYKDDEETAQNKTEKQREIIRAYKVLMLLDKPYNEEYDKVHTQRRTPNPVTEEDFFDADGRLKNFYRALNIDPDESIETIANLIESKLNYCQIETNDTPEERRQKLESKATLELAYDVLCGPMRDAYDDAYHEFFDFWNNIADEFNKLTVYEDDIYREDGTIIDYYDVLSVPKEAGDDDIQTAFEIAITACMEKSNDDESTIDRKRARKSELLLAFKILRNYKDEYDKLLVKGEDTMTPEELRKEYEEKERAAKEAFEAAEMAKVNEKVEKAKADAEEYKHKSEEAKEKEEDAKAQLEAEKVKKKAAKEAAKEAKKEAKRAKKIAKKTAKKAKKIEKEVKKIEKKTKKRKVLIRKSMSGRFMAIPEFMKDHWKGITAGVVAAATVTGTAFAIKHYLDKTETIEPTDRPSYGDTKDETTANPTITTPEDAKPEVDKDNGFEVESSTEAIYKNWTDAGITITEEEVQELTNFTYGQNSTITADDVEEMIRNAITAVVIPAYNNISAGEQIAEVKPIDVSSLLPDNDPASKAIMELEDCLNSMTTDFANIEDYATIALGKQVRVIALNETVDGFNQKSSSAPARLIWAELAQGINMFAGTFDEDFQIEIDGTSYSLSDITGSMSLQSIITGAKADMGINAKTMRYQRR